MMNQSTKSLRASTPDNQPFVLLANRVSQVVRTYTTRPLIWVVGGTYLVVFAILIWATMQSRSNSPRMPAYPEITFSQKSLLLATPDSMQSFERGQLDKSVTTVIVVWPEIAAEHIKKLRQCPELRVLKLGRTGGAELKEDEAQAISELKRLQTLSLEGQRLAPSIWKHLGQLPLLRTLDLSGCTLTGDYSGLESLTHVETLILGSPLSGEVKGDSGSILPYLKLIPNLKTLVVWGVSGKGATMKDVPKEIRGINSLRVLFVNENAPGFPGFESLQRELPQVMVRPSFVDTERPMVVVAIIFLDAILIFLLGVQLQSHFSHSGANLIPHYTWPHLIPVIAVWLLGIGSSVVPLLLRDVPVLSALGAAMAPWMLFSSMALAGTSAQSSSRGRAWILLPFVVLGITWVPLTTLAFQSNKSSIDWYLRGNDPAWAWFFIVVGILTSCESLRRSLGSNRRFAEFGIHSPPLGFNPAATAAWQQEFYWGHLAASQNSTFVDRWRNRRLCSAMEAATQSGWFPRVRLWIAGNASNGNVAPLMAAAGAIAFVGVIWLGLGSFSSLQNLWSLANPGTLLASMLIPDFPVFVIANIWRTRRPLFAVESLRPMTRRQFARQIAAALAWDMSTIGGLYLIILAWYTAVADPHLWTVSWTFAMFVYFVARWTVVYGIVLWSLVIRRDWVLVLIGSLSAYAFVFVNVAMIFLQSRMFGVEPLPSDMPDFGPGIITCGAVAVGIAGCVVCRMGYNRWASMELA